MPIYYPANIRPWLLASADFNGDNHLDVVALGTNPDAFIVYLGNGDGTFNQLAATATTEPFGLPPALQIGDVNGDHIPDIVTAEAVHLGNGDGTFGAALPFGGNRNRAVATGDFNNDGKLDVVISVSTGDSLNLLFGQGDGHFAGSQIATGGRRFDKLAAGDLNGDGLTDFVSLDLLPEPIGQTNVYHAQIFINSGGGTFQQSDIVIGSLSKSPSDQNAIVGDSRSILLQDVNGDGKLDLVASNDYDAVTVLLGNGDGTLQPRTDYHTAFGGKPEQIAIADADGDGTLDIAAVTSNGVQLFEGAGDGTFHRSDSDFSGGNGPRGLVVGDFDGAFTPDFVVAAYFGNQVGIEYDFTGLTLQGTSGDDIFHGSRGADRMIGGLGNDTYYDGFGGLHQDTIVEAPGEGVDTVIEVGPSYAAPLNSEIEILRAADFASTAFVSLAGNGIANSIYGNEGINGLSGGGGDDYILGYGGNDNMAGGDGDDAMDGGAGDDLMLGGSGNDYMLGGDGNDLMDGGTGADRMFGGAGNDIYYVDNVGDQISEADGQGTDIIISSVSYILAAGTSVEVLTTDSDAGNTPINLAGNELANSIYGNEGANVLSGGGGGDYLVGAGGADTLNGGDGEDALDGGAGNDVLSGGADNDYLVGGAGADLMDGGTGADRMFGGLGDDLYLVDNVGDQVSEAAGQGNDRIASSIDYVISAGNSVEVLTTDSDSGTSALSLTGNELANSIYGNAGSNFLSGGGGDDYLVGLGGDDFLHGGAGQDAIDGGAGDDNLNGGADADYLVGGAGNDYFAFADTLGPGNVDRIADFSHGADHIALDDAVFTGLAPGSLPASAFVVGTAAQDADDRIIYDSATGALYFDADGNGAGAAVQFATLVGAPANLSASDFIVY